MAQHLEGAVPAEADEAHHHRRQADGHRQASSELDVSAEEKDEGRDEELAARHPHHCSDDADDEAGNEPGHDLGRAMQHRAIRVDAMREHQHHRDGEQHDADDLVEPAVAQLGCPSRTQPCADQTAGQQVDDARPARRNLVRRHGAHAEEQRARDHDEAHGLVQDDRVKRDEAEQANEDGQSELGPAQPDEPAQDADGSAGKGGAQDALRTLSNHGRHGPRL